QTPAGWLSVSMMAAITGFLFFNFNPAKVFMGDCGALPIGFFLANAVVSTSEHLSRWSVLLVPCLILFVPVFDTVLVMVTRRMSGKPISQGGRDHSSHRLVLAGLDDRKAVVVLYTVAVIAGAMAYLWYLKPGLAAAACGIFFLIASLLFWLYLARLGSQPSSQDQPANPR